MEALGCCHHDRIDQTQLQRTVFSRDLIGADHILLPPVFHGEGALGQIRQKYFLCSGAELARDEIIDLGENRPGEEPLARTFIVKGADLTMVLVTLVEQRQDRARIGDDHRDLPNPVSSSSARSLRSRRPLVNLPTLLGRRRGVCRAAYSATASRTSSAGVRLIRRAIRFNAR